MQCHSGEEVDANGKKKFLVVLSKRETWGDSTFGIKKNKIKI